MEIRNDFHSLSSQLSEKLKRPKARFRDSVDREEAVGRGEGRLGDSGFFEDVAGDPPEHSFALIIQFDTSSDDECGGFEAVDRRVVSPIHILARLGGERVPLGPEERGFSSFFSDSFQGVAVEFSRSVGGFAFVVVPLILRIDVGADEVDGDAPLGAVGEEFGDFASLGAGGAADSQNRVDAFDGGGGAGVEFDVLVPGSIPKGAEVGLIPNFEVPGSDLFKAIPTDAVAGEGLDEGFPFGEVARRGDVHAPPEEGGRSAGEGGGHRAEFDERLHANFEQKIEDFVDLIPLEMEHAFGVAKGDEHVVVEEAMEAAVFEADFASAESEMFLNVGAE